MNPTAALRPSPSKTLAAGGTAHQLAGASIAENTWRAYSGALRRLEEWLGGRPLSDPLLAAYLGHLFDAGVSPAVAGQVVASVRFRAHLAGIPSPAGEATTRVLAGFRRAGRARGRGPADGVRWEQADAAAALAANGGALAGLRDAAILAIASDALLRVSEVAALEFADVNPSDSTVTVRHSKTDPEGAGAVAYLGPATLKRIRTWTTAGGVSGNGSPRARSAQSSAPGPRRPASLAACRATRSGWAQHSPWPPPAPRLWKCSRPAAGAPLPCPASTSAANSPPVAPSLASATAPRAIRAPKTREQTRRIMGKIGFNGSVVPSASIAAELVFDPKIVVDRFVGRISHRLNPNFQAFLSG